jgi:hypothetical protein
MSFVLTVVVFGGLDTKTKVAAPKLEHVIEDGEWTGSSILVYRPLTWAHDQQPPGRAFSGTRDSASFR